MIYQKEITLPPFKRGFHLITSIILDNCEILPEKGIMNLFLKHTSAGLTLNENADPSVRVDFESFISSLIPDDNSLYTHTSEGIDDMPAHIKTAFFGSSLSIPITNNRLNMGIWQGIYLCEFRNNVHQRNITLTIYS